jgi:hypothetical protein
VPKRQILEDGGNISMLSSDSCTGQLAPLKSGNIYTINIGAGSACACRMVVNESGANVRGTLDLRDNTNTVLVSQPQR